jgi:hypothetical protein
VTPVTCDRARRPAGVRLGSTWGAESDEGRRGSWAPQHSRDGGRMRVGSSPTRSRKPNALSTSSARRVAPVFPHRFHPHATGATMSVHLPWFDLFYILYIYICIPTDLCYPLFASACRRDKWKKKRVRRLKRKRRKMRARSSKWRQSLMPIFVMFSPC